MNTQTWMLDVLADLRDFARAQGHDDLAEQLDDTLLLAAATLAQADLQDCDDDPSDLTPDRDAPAAIPPGTRLI